MKRILMCMLFSVIAYAPNTYGCDFCGSSNSASGSFDQFGQNNENAIGIAWAVNSLSNRNDEASDFAYVLNTWSISGTYAIKEVIVLNTVLPFQLLNSELNGLKRNDFGLGDLSFSASYLALDKAKEKEGKIRNHKLSITLGLEFPTGRYQEDIDESQLGYQLGSQSWDGIFNVGYSFILNQWGVHIHQFAKINGQNKFNYRFGHQYLSGLGLSYKIKLKDAFLTPRTGLKWLYQRRDAVNGLFENLTGGKFLHYNIGANFNFYNYTLSASSSIPILSKTNYGTRSIGSEFKIQFLYTF